MGSPILCISGASSLLEAPLHPNLVEALLEETKRYFSGWAHFSWLEVLKGQLRVMSDNCKLERIGLTTSFARGTERNLKVDSAPVAWEDQLAQDVFRAVWQQLKFRSGSMMWHVVGAPGCTAGLLHDDPSLVRKSLDFLSKVEDCLSEAEAIGTTLMKEMTFGQGFRSPLMKWVAKALRTTNYESVCDELKEVLEGMWSGLLNSKLIEDLNKQQREREQRGNLNKTVSRAEAWSLPTQHKLLHSYGRTEVKHGAALAVPRSFDLGSMFDPSPGPAEKQSETVKEEVRFIKDVTGNIVWPTFSPESQQQVHCDLALLLFLQGGSREWNLVNDAWHSSLLPEGCIIEKHGDYFFVVRTYRRGALTWPMKRRDTNTFAFDLTITALVWHFAFDTTTWRVQAFVPMSPLHQFLQLGSGFEGILLVGNGGPVPLLDHHVQCSFRGVPENTLRKLHEKLEVRPLPATESCTQLDSVMTLTVGVLAHLCKGMPLEKILAGLMYNKFADDSFADCPDVDPEFLKDTVLPQDQEKIQSNTAKVAEKKLAMVDQQVKFRTAAVACIELANKHSGSTFLRIDKPPGPSAGKKGVVKAGTATRAYADLAMDADTSLKRLAPTDAKIWTDLANGRWKVSLPKSPGGQRSVSWTNVGQEAAVRVALRQLWDWKFAVDGQNPPPEVERFLAS